MKKLFGSALLVILGLAPNLARAEDAVSGDFIIKFKPGYAAMMMQQLGALAEGGGELEMLSEDLVHVQAAPQKLSQINSENMITQLNQLPGVEYAQPNYRISLMEDYRTQDPRLRQIAEDVLSGRVAEDLLPESLLSLIPNGIKFPKFGKDGNKIPDLPGTVVPSKSGVDPMLSQQWGMSSIGATSAWKVFRGNKKIVVAVIDTGVDYTHEDLVGNIWHNTKEIPGNGIDDDHNGFVDDVIGWDFADNTNKPYDVTTSTFQMFLGGGNPGHGTHCAGNVGAVGNNGVGISGVDPNVSIMPIRFLNAKGQGNTATAVKAINYAVANGANVLSNSWGSEGENPKENNQALKDAIKNALAHNVLFVAAAGNGHVGKGYDNDTDARPATPASYDIPNIISVAAVDRNDRLGKFSNWGKKTVHVAAPGVAVYSTMTHNRYSSKVALGMTWDGTSMAAPHVAGAAALIWAAHPSYTALDVKNVLLKTVTKVPALTGLTVSGGKINVQAALQ